MRILITLLALCVLAFADVPNGSEVTQTVTINSAYVSETTTDFLLPFKVPRTGDILANCTSAANVAMTNLNDTLRRARWVVYTADTLYVYAHTAKSTSANTDYRLHYGLTLNEVNTSSAFTNCGVTNYWGFNELSGTTVADYAKGLTLTVGGGSTLGGTGTFYGGLTGGASGYAGISNAVMSGKTAFTHSMVINATDYANTPVIASAREGSTVRYQVNVGAGSRLFVYIGSTTNYGTVPLSDIPAGTPHFLMIDYDGAQATNEARLKIFVNGVAKTVTFTGTIPTSIPTYSLSPIFDMGGLRLGDYYLKGMLDESCLMSGATSGANEMDRYRVLLEPSTFYTLGAVIGVSVTPNAHTNAFRRNIKWESFKRAYK